MSQRLFYERYVRAFEEAERCLDVAGGLAGADQRRLFVQTLFNRLLFLRFVEIKNWLEFEGRFDYLRALYDAGGVPGQTTYRSRIVPLFHALSGGTPCQVELIGNVPVLAGGPFDETDLDRRAGDVPDDVLAHLIGDDGLFYACRFAISESPTGDDATAVDPEMLGTVFEELVTRRSESGAYYTPRPVVAFMCREALKSYLTDKTELAAESIQRFVDEGLTAGWNRSDGCRIEAALDDLRAIDPACGSGAYLVGLVHEMVGLYERLSDAGLLRRPFSRYELKCRIIGMNLYGVDLDPLATQIARLRLWLSLAVDSDKPCTLPTLDGRIIAGDALAAVFPAESPLNGYDVVLANPPYVRQELIGRAAKRVLQKRFAGAVGGKSDLYCHFFARSLELLREGGVFICICSGSWLDVGFGVKLQAFLLSHARIVAVYDSLVERQFASAAINTVISVVRKQPPEGSPPTRFVVFREPLETAVREPAARRELCVTRDELWDPSGPPEKPGHGGRPYRGGKWSGRYLRAPESFVELLRHPGSLVPLGQSEDWSIGRGRRTGCDDFFYLTCAQAREWNIERRYLQLLVKSPVQFRQTPPCTSCLARDWFVFLCHTDESNLQGTHALRYIRHGERSGVASRNLTSHVGRWYDLGRQTAPDLILPIAFHERFFVVVNDSRAAIHQRFATISVARHRQSLVPAIAALLSSSLVVLFAEVLGRHGLGQGALDFPPDDWRDMLIPDVARIAPPDLAQLATCWKTLKRRPPLAFSAAACDPLQERLDSIVARLIGRDKLFMESVRRDAVGLISSRLAKARASKSYKGRASTSPFRKGRQRG